MKHSFIYCKYKILYFSLLMTSFTYSKEARRHQYRNFTVLQEISRNTRKIGASVFSWNIFVSSYREKERKVQIYVGEFLEILVATYLKIYRAIIRYGIVICFKKRLRRLSNRMSENSDNFLSDESLSIVMSNPKLCQSLYTSDDKQFLSKELRLKHRSIRQTFLSLTSI